MSPQIILVADEDLDTRIILRTLLQQQGYEVIDAGNAVAAMAALKLPISLVILNHPMRVSEDMTLARWLRAQAATREVPIINLTSRAIPVLMEEAERLGVNVTLTKPLDVTVIIKLVRELTSPMMTSDM